MQKQEASSCSSGTNPCFRVCRKKGGVPGSAFCRPGFLILKPHYQFDLLLPSPLLALCASSRLLQNKEHESLNDGLLIGILWLGNYEMNISYFIIKMSLPHPWKDRHRGRDQAPFGTGLHWPPIPSPLCSLLGSSWGDWFSLIVVTLWPHTGLSVTWLWALSMAKVKRVAIYGQNRGLSLWSGLAGCSIHNWVLILILGLGLGFRLLWSPTRERKEENDH